MSPGLIYNFLLKWHPLGFELSKKRIYILHMDNHERTLRRPVIQTFILHYIFIGQKQYFNKALPYLKNTAFIIFIPVPRKRYLKT